MIFFLIVSAVMGATIFLVLRISNRFGLKIHGGALAVTAVLSLLVDLLAIKLSPVPDKWYFIRLFALIFVAAAAVTAFNKFLTETEIESRHE